MESKKSGRSESYIRRFVDDIKKDKKKKNKWEKMIFITDPWLLSLGEKHILL